eukprot:COSAG04_NODE_25021_length_313_cov_0.728972_1_plen_74_part_10
MELLLKRGANPNLRQDGLGRTPLMEAAARGFSPHVRLLLKANAEVDAVDEHAGVEEREGFTAFHFACFNDHPFC